MQKPFCRKAATGYRLHQRLPGYSTAYTKDFLAGNYQLHVTFQLFTFANLRALATLEVAMDTTSIPQRGGYIQTGTQRMA